MAWPETSVPTEPSRPDPGPVTVSRLQGLLAPLLGVRDPTTLESETPLLSFGLDSLTAVEFARALSRDLGRPVAPDFIYNHPTLAQAVQALTTRRPAVARPEGYLLRAPRWQDVAPGRTTTSGWTVAGGSALAGAMRQTLTADAANLLDLSALEVAPSAGRTERDALFPGLLERLRRRLGTAGRIALVVPSEGAITGLVEGLAVALAAEQPAWTVRTVRLDPDLADPVVRLTQELGTDDDETRVRLGRSGRQALRLVPVPTRGAWRASPDATYLVTGGSRGVGALVAAHLVDRGARHLVLAARRPVMPSALAGGVARIRLRAVDLGDAAGVAALMTELRATHPPLRGIFHAAGVTADGLLAAGEWDRWAAAFPAKADGARHLDSLSRQLDLENFVLFSSSTAWFGLTGTSGYAAANGFLDGLAHERRAAGLPAVSIAWGAWQGVGMAADPGLWQDGRVPSLPPGAALTALDAALASDEASGTGNQPGLASGHGPPPRGTTEAGRGGRRRVTQHEPVAIIGLGCRFAGAADDAAAFWALLSGGGSAIAPVPAARWDHTKWHSDDPSARGRTTQAAGGFLPDIDQFDAAFFGIAPREAVQMDPQQRLVLEVSWRALEHAGIAPTALNGHAAGVYLGLYNDNYGMIGRGAPDATLIDGWSASGTHTSVAPGRIAFQLGLTGPAIAVDTACSSSLTAVHLAVQALRARDCEMALAGGVHLILSPARTGGKFAAGGSLQHWALPRVRCRGGWFRPRRRLRRAGAEAAVGGCGVG